MSKDAQIRQSRYIYGKRGRTIFSEEVALRAFSICATEVESLGLVGLKRKTKKVFREFMLQHHPDVKKRNPKTKHFIKTGAWITAGNEINHISHWFRKYREIMDLQYLPMTLFNFEKILEVQKGFKNTADIDFGLNGPDDYGKATELLSGQVHPIF